jgi:hypothetical protein
MGPAASMPLKPEPLLPYTTCPTHVQCDYAVPAPRPAMSGPGGRHGGMTSAQVSGGGCSAVAVGHSAGAGPSRPRFNPFSARGTPGPSPAGSARASAYPLSLRQLLPVLEAVGGLARHQRCVPQPRCSHLHSLVHSSFLHGARQGHSWLAGVQVSYSRTARELDRLCKEGAAQA